MNFRVTKIDIGNYKTIRYEFEKSRNLGRKDRAGGKKVYRRLEGRKEGGEKERSKT